MFNVTFKKYLAIVLLFAFPVILANQYYVDDMGRSTAGYTLWGIDGRPVADLIMSIFNMSFRMADLAPLPLLASIALLALALSLYRERFFNSEKWSFFVPLAFLANPALISMFSYRFDVLTFTCAITLGFFIFIYEHKRFLVNLIFGAIMVSLVMGTYQALINLVALLIICEMNKNLNAKTHPIQLIKIIALRCSQIILGAILYFKIILPWSFSGVHSTSHPAIASDLPKAVLSNSGDYFRFVSSHFYSIGGDTIFMSSAAVILAMSAILLFQYMRVYWREKSSFIVLFSAVISSTLALPLTMAAFLVLENSLAGAVHVYMAISGYYLLFATMLYYTLGKLKPFSLVIIIPIFNAFGLMYAYGNALKAQDFVNKQIASGIKTATERYDYNTKYIVFNGPNPRANVVVNSRENYPLIDVSVMNYFYNWYWAIANLSINGVQQLYPPTDMALKAQQEICSYKQLYKNQDFIAYEDKKVIVIDFSKTKCN